MLTLLLDQRKLVLKLMGMLAMKLAFELQLLVLNLDLLYLERAVHLDLCLGQEGMPALTLLIDIKLVQVQLKPFELLLLRVLVRFNQQDLELDLPMVPLPLMPMLLRYKLQWITSQPMKQLLVVMLLLLDQ